MDLLIFASDICVNPRHSKWIAPLLLLADSILCMLIIWKIPYTEIDWTTYMQQVSLFLSGERDYILLKGSTGPLVYPAAHVYIYSFLYHVTDEGRDIAFAQVLFAGLYLATLCSVMGCYRSMRAPPYLFPLLVLSKRLHSVFILRLFNDAIATFFLWTTILLLQRRRWDAGVIIWATGVGVKMTMLLVAPAIGVILVLGTGLYRALGLGITAFLVQVLLAIPFLRINATNYVSKAFEFSRQFLFKWTVNWRFLGEEVFLSAYFARLLLVAHVLLLASFAAFHWIRPSGLNLMDFIASSIRGRKPQTNFTSSFVGTTILTSLAIGLLCARTLHYQFFAYLSWTTPLLLWKSGLHPVFIYLMCGAQEWAWNVFPSTTISSLTVVLCLSVQVFGVLRNAYRVYRMENRARLKENAAQTKKQ